MSLSRPPAPEPLPHPVVDNHCHLDMTLDGSTELTVPDAIERAAAADPELIHDLARCTSQKCAFHGAVLVFCHSSGVTVCMERAWISSRMRSPSAA